VDIETNKSNISYFVQQHNTDLPDCKNEKQNVSYLFAFMKQKFKTKNVQFQNIFIYIYSPSPQQKVMECRPVCNTKNFEEMQEAW